MYGQLPLLLDPFRRATLPRIGSIVSVRNCDCTVSISLEMLQAEVVLIWCVLNRSAEHLTCKKQVPIKFHLFPLFWRLSFLHFSMFSDYRLSIMKSSLVDDFEHYFEHVHLFLLFSSWPFSSFFAHSSSVLIICVLCQGLHGHDIAKQRSLFWKVLSKRCRLFQTVFSKTAKCSFIKAVGFIGRPFIALACRMRR